MIVSILAGSTNIHFLRIHMSQELNFSHPEITLFFLGIKLVVPQGLENNPQMFGMCFIRLGIN